MKNQNLKTKETNSKGITLISLVITIIVLLILAGVTIATLTGDNGLLQKSTSAKEASTDGEIEEQIKLAYLEYETVKPTNPNVDPIKNMKDSLEKIYGENTISITKQDDVFNINIKNKDNSFYLFNGEVGILKTLDDYGVQIGDYINYDCYTGVESSKLYYKSLESKNGSYDQEFEVTESDKTMKWRILGIDAKGDLMITTADTIKTKQGNSYRLYGKEGYINGPNELNIISNIFGNGKYAKNSRSMKVDDINKITQYVINEPAKYTYTKKEDGKIYRNDSTTSSQTKFEYYKTNPNEQWKQLINIGDTSSEIYDTSYGYNDINTSQKAKKMIVFGEDDETKLTFWITDRCLYCADSYVYYRIRSISSGSLGSQGIWCSNGGPCSVINKDIRPVVILSSNIILSGSSENGWTIQ